MKTAVIIKGNPKLIANAHAEQFYAELAALLVEHGFGVIFDAGEPYTAPPAADLWIGHSRGADRLRFASKETVIIGIGVPETTDDAVMFPVINHPEDILARQVFSRGEALDEYTASDVTILRLHFMLTEDMRETLRKLIIEI